MTKQVRNFLCGLLALWVLAILGLAFVVMKDLHAPSSALIGLFQKTTPAAPKVALVSEKPEEHKAKEQKTAEEKPKADASKNMHIAEKYPLLPMGRKPGKAVVQGGTLEKVENGYIFTVPYTGTIYNYTTYTIGSKRARIFDLRGDIRCDYHELSFGKTSDIRMIQMAMHEGYARISVIGRTHIESYTQEIRSTPTALQIYLTPAVQ